MKVYRRIKDLREDMDLTQSRLAARLNVSQRSYSYYENGKRVISPDLLVRLAQFYGTSVDYILGLTDNPEPYRRRTDIPGRLRQKTTKANIKK